MDSLTPPELRAVAETTLSSLLPKKSQKVYEKDYKIFLKWCEEKGVTNLTENVLLAFFDAKSKINKPSTLWSLYSKLRACININKNIDISRYAKLQAFLKRQSEGYEPKKSKILEYEHLKAFLTKADDNIYLAVKVALIMGYNGACRREELINILIDDIEINKNDIILVKIPKTKTNVPRHFVIVEKLWMDRIKKYLNLRPKNTTHKRFFLTFRNGYCINSPIGINTMGKIPSLIAKYLNFPNPECYTGHCFRRSSISHLANNGSDLVTIKKHGGWKSSAVAEGYIDTSLQRKIEVAQMLSVSSPFSNSPIVASSSSIAPTPSTSQYISNEAQKVIEHENNYEQSIVSNQNMPDIKFSAQDTSTVTINVYTNCTIQHK